MIKTVVKQIGRIEGKLRKSLQATSTLLAVGVPDRAFGFHGGIGDNLLCSIVARELRKRGESRISILTRYPQLFWHNPDIHSSLPEGRFSRALLAQLKVPATYLTYGRHITAENRNLLPPYHIVVEMCQRASIRGEIELRPYFTLTPEELKGGRLSERQVAIQSSGMSAQFAVILKEWFPDRFERVVDALRGRFDFVQIGAREDPPLKGALDLRGKTTLRQTAAILANSVVFVGLAGFPMHLARAVDCRSVIVYGGRELPSITGYACNQNLSRLPPCAPCGLYDDCEYHRDCMKQIEAGDVVLAIEHQARQYGIPLPVETVPVPSARWSA